MILVHMDPTSANQGRVSVHIHFQVLANSSRWDIALYTLNIALEIYDGLLSTDDALSMLVEYFLLNNLVFNNLFYPTSQRHPLPSWNSAKGTETCGACTSVPPTRINMGRWCESLQPNLSSSPPPTILASNDPHLDALNRDAHALQPRNLACRGRHDLFSHFLNINNNTLLPYRTSRCVKRNPPSRPSCYSSTPFQYHSKPTRRRWLISICRTPTSSQHHGEQQYVQTTTALPFYSLLGCRCSIAIPIPISP